MWIAGIPATNQSFVYAQDSQKLLQQQNAVAGSIKVAAGGGNDTGPLTLFLPSKIDIKTGQSVTWYNPTTVGEPHTVTFIFDNTTFAGVVSPLGVSNTTKFVPLPPVSNNAPILLPNKDGTNTI
jgi:plastocyanin